MSRVIACLLVAMVGAWARATPDDPRRALVIRDGVLLRAKPGTAAPVIGVVHRNQVVMVRKETTMLEERGGRRAHWFLVSVGDLEGWLFGRYVTFDIPVPEPDTYRPVAPMDWFDRRFGPGEQYRGSHPRDMRLSIEEYRQLILAVEQGDPRAAYVLLHTLYADVLTRPNDPELHYWKPKLESEALVMNMLVNSSPMDSSLHKVTKGLPAIWWTRTRVMRAVEVTGGFVAWSFPLDSSLWSDPDLARVLASQGLLGSFYQRFSEAVRGDRNLAEHAAKADYRNYRFMTEPIRKDRALSMLALTKCPDMIQFLPEALQGDEELLEAWTQHLDHRIGPDAVHLPPHLADNLELARKTMVRFPESYCWYSDSVRSDLFLFRYASGLTACVWRCAPPKIRATEFFIQAKERCPRGH